MKKGDYLFVYGSLRLGETADLSNNPAVTYIGEDRINGKLYAVSWFPGVKTTPGHFDPGLASVAGDVFLIDDDSVVPSLDGYEAYPHLYDRIETETAQGLHVWVYTYNGGVSEDARVMNGDWSRRIEVTLPQQAA